MEDDDYGMGPGLPAEEEYTEESELEEANYDFGPSVEDGQEEEEEEEEEEEVEEVSFIPEFVEEPYPDKDKEPWPLEDVKEYFYKQALHAVLKDQGVDITSQRAIDEALDAAEKNQPRKMREFEERLKKDAEKEAEKYKKNVYEPWHEQYNNAKTAEEFKEALEHYPEAFEYWEELKVIGPEFFKHNPKYIDSPLKALPILLKEVKIMGKMPREKARPSFTVEKGRRSRPAPKSKESRVLLSNKIDNPGDWIQRI